MMKFSNNLSKDDSFKSEKILEPLLNTHFNLHGLLYTSTSILLVITSFIFSIVSGFILKEFSSLELFVKLAGGVLVLSSLSALLLCLVIIRPAFRHKMGNTNFYYMDVLNRFKNEQEYISKLKEISGNENERIKFFIDEYYQLAEHVLMPKFKLIKLATEILIYGLISSVVLFVISLFV